MERRSVRRLARLHVAVGNALRVGGGFERVLHHRPLTAEVGERFAPLHERALRERVAQDPTGVHAVCHQRRVVGEAFVGRELRPADHVADPRPVLRRLEAREREHPTVLGLVVRGQGVDAHPVHRRRGPRGVGEQRERDGLSHGPHPDTEERHVDHRRLAGALAVVERTHHPARDRHRADGVAEPGRRGNRDVVVLGSLVPDRDAGSAPERQRVIRALVGVGAVRALPGSPHVDDLRVVRTDVVDVDPQLRAHTRQLVGEEHVAGGRQPVQDVEALVGHEVEAEAVLTPVGVLEQRVHVGWDVDGAAHRETAHGVAPLDVLDLDDLGSPVGEERRGGGHEGVLGHLEDADALHHCGHGILRCGRGCGDAIVARRPRPRSRRDSTRRIGCSVSRPRRPSSTARPARARTCRARPRRW